MIPAKAMPRPLSLLGSALILLSDKIPNTKATTSGVMVTRIGILGGEVAKRDKVKDNEGTNNPQTREAIARRSQRSGPAKFESSFEGGLGCLDTGGGGIGGGNEFTVEP